MAVNTIPVFVKTPKITPAAFTNSDSANTKKTIATIGSDGSKLLAVPITSTDTSSRIGQLWLTRSATSYLLGSFTVPAASGSDGATVTADALTTIKASWAVDNDGQRYNFGESGDTIQYSFTTQVTSAKEIDVTCTFGNFS